MEAQQSLADATLTSPISGTIAAVGVAPGATVSAGSSDDAITVMTTSAYESTASLTTAQAAEVKVGDPAQVTVDGTSGTNVVHWSRYDEASMPMLMMTEGR